MQNLYEKWTDSIPLIHLCLYYGLSVLSGEPLALDKKDSFQEELKEE